VAIIVIWNIKHGPGNLSDLVAQTNSAPATAHCGSVIAVSDVISNQSSTVQAGATVACMYMNTSLTIVGASNLGTHSTSAIGPKGKFTWSGNVTVPGTQPAGTNYFMTVCDCQNNVLESNENNNTNYWIIVISCP